MGTHSEAQLDTKFVDFMKQLNLYLNHFPKFEKYGLYTFSQALRSGSAEALASCLGHAKRTASLRHMLGLMELRGVAA